MRILQVFFVTMSLAVGYVSATEEVKEDKIYIEPQNILIEGKNILVNIGSSWQVAGTLRSDAQGIYVMANEKWPLPFRCERCGRTNPGYLIVCERCGTPRDD